MDSVSPCFVPSVSLPSRTVSVRPSVCGTRVPRASLGKLPSPGIPSGQDPLEGAPLRDYVPRPLETYDDRSFTDPIPQTWEGEITTIGVTDIEPVTKESLEKARQVQVDNTSTSAFLEFSDTVRAERKAQLEAQAARNSVEQDGRATCGEAEGREFVSNAIPIYYEGVKCVEYWGAANGPVPRLFG